MSDVVERVNFTLPRMTKGRLIAAILAAALLIVFLVPNAHPIAILVTAAGLAGALAAILCGLTFWPQARVRMARLLNARNLTFRYKSVRRNAAAVALVGLSFVAVKVIAVATRSTPAPSPDEIVRKRLSEARERAAVPDKVEWQFNRNGKALIPAGLPTPEQWVSVGKSAEGGGEAATMTWVKPAGKDPSVWTEMFEYHDLSEESISPREFFAQFKAGQARQCPSATVSLIELSATELMFEAKTNGCPRYGEVDEIDRYLFGKSDLFQLSYTVKAREMTPAQRDAGSKAVRAPRLQRSR